MTIRVFVAEDHLVTQWGLQHLIDQAQPQMSVVGTASRYLELLAHAALPSADVVLLDLDLAGHDAAQSIHELQALCSGRILVLTASDDLDLHRDVAMKGARGVVHKGEPAATLLRAIERVHAGEVWLNRALLGKVIGRLTGQGGPDQPVEPCRKSIVSLTRREREIVGRLASMAGAKQMAVASELGMSEHTLRNHLTAIYSKLRVRGRLELHLFALEHKLADSQHRRDAPAQRSAA
jgi:two-component system nitrate/nitrite response regulator NarL